MKAKVGVLLVHGIGTQKEGSLIDGWGNNLKKEVTAILLSQGYTVDFDADIRVSEYIWDPQVRAFSSFVVSMWTLINLPRISAIHTALSYRAIEDSRPIQTFREQLELTRSGKQLSVILHDLRGLSVRIRNTVWRGWALPAVACPLVLLIWLLNPIIVVVTGFLGLLWPPSWKLRRSEKSNKRIFMPWRPLRIANAIMARVIGDAYIWLASPLGRVLSKGSQEVLITDFYRKLKVLQDECSKTVVIAHSQGAAIAVAALTRNLQGPLTESKTIASKNKEKMTPPSHLVTVGGGHRLLQGIYESTFAHSRLTVPTALLIFCQLVITYFGVMFIGPYIGFLMLWFILVPLYVFYRAVAAVSGKSVDPGLSATLTDFNSLLLFRMTYSLVPLLLSVYFGCAVAVAFATFKLGRPAVARNPLLVCSWTEIFSRFDPVCIGPAITPGLVRSAVSRNWRPPRNLQHEALETWTLPARLPVLEHTSYFANGSASLRAIAIAVAAQMKSSAVELTLPAANARVLKSGNFWIIGARLVIAGILIIGCIVVLFSPVSRALLTS